MSAPVTIPGRDGVGMKRFAIYTHPGRESERGWPQLGGEEMEQTCARLSDWYYHADDVVAAIEAKDRKIADLRARLAAVRERCEANNWGGTARMCDVHR